MIRVNYSNSKNHIHFSKLMIASNVLIMYTYNVIQNLRLFNLCTNKPYILRNKYKIICLETYIYMKDEEIGETYEHINEKAYYILCLSLIHI